MKKEYALFFIVGLFLLAYVLDTAVNPLALNLKTPYEYFNREYVTQFPFTTASIFIKGLGLFLAPLWLLSFMERQFTVKGIVLLILASLMQLYALQDIITGNKLVPIEWSLSISLAGAALLVPMLVYFIRGFFSSIHGSLVGEAPEAPKTPPSEESIL